MLEGAAATRVTWRWKFLDLFMGCEVDFLWDFYVISMGFQWKTDVLR
jgi:hypothetical protein